VNATLKLPATLIAALVETMPERLAAHRAARVVSRDKHADFPGVPPHTTGNKDGRADLYLPDLA